MSDPKWSTCLIPVFSEAVSALACIISENLMDSMLTKELLTPSRYVEMIDSLGSAGIDKSKSARHLLMTLMQSPLPSFDVFCSTLKEFRGGDQLLSLLTSSTGGHVTEQDSDSSRESTSLVATHQKASFREGASRSTRLKKSNVDQVLPWSSMGESSSENSTPDSGVLIDTGLSSLEEILVHIDKALKEDFEPYRNGVESVIRNVVKKGIMRVDVKFRFIDGLPLSVPLTRQVGKADLTIKIPLQCVLRIFLPNINEERFLLQKERLLRAFPSLLGCKRIERLRGSCDVLLTLSGIDFIKFVSDLHNPRGLITFIQIDPYAEIQFGILEPVKVSRLLRQSPLLMPVTKAFSSIEHFCNETAKRHAETFRSRFLSAYYSLDIAEECLESGLRRKKLKSTLEETEKVQCKPSSAERKLFRIKEMVDKDSRTALKTKQQIETLKGILSSTIRKIEMKGHFGFACSSGKADFVKKLIDTGVNVNEADENGRFALEQACYSNHFEIGRMLISSGANINKEDKFGRFPLLAACEKGNIEIARLLIASRANVNQANKIRRSPLASACSGGHFELAKLLINAGGDVNLSVKIGCDPLLPVACSSGQSNLVELLLENGCNPNSRNQLGKSALLCACSHSHYSIGTLLMNSSIRLDSYCYQPVVETIIRQHTLVREISSDALNIVKMILSQSPGLAALRDENGRFSHELPCPTELKEVLLCFWAQYQYRERYAQGTVKSNQVMICVIGKAEARRTTLVQSLHANYASQKIGVEITAVETSYADKIVVVDFAGQPFFHKMHKQLFSSSSTIFLLVVDLTQSEEEHRRLSHYLLSFVKRCVRLPEKACIVVYGSYFSRELQKRLVTYLRAEFNQWFVITLAFSSGSIDDLDLSGLRLAHHHLFNAAKSVPAIFETVQQTFLPILRNPKSASASPTIFRKFGNLVLAASSRYRLTQNLRQNVFRALKRIVPNSNELSDFPPIRCIDAKLFKKLAVESVCAGLSERDQDLLVSFLQATGEILVIDDAVVIDLPWVCRRGINSLFSISSSISRTRFDTGTTSRESIQKFFEKRDTKLSRIMIQLLCSLELCYPVDEQASRYFIPALIQEGFPPHVWRKNSLMTVYVGRRLMSEEKADILPPETMPLIQLNARNAPCFHTLQIIVWHGGLAIEQTINRYLVEGMVVGSARNTCLI
ncbi:uncharacterized protein [Oscarella lobularis]|uniref:uncharacterized protein n=1 Tax=Oscarella lobularis TaxID=121494 RepID=UPI003313F831